MGLHHARSRVANEQLEEVEEIVDYITDQLDSHNIKVSK